MRQGTTPTHTFKLPCPPSEVKDLRVTYAVGDRIVLEKALADCREAEDGMAVTLSQEETFLFEANTKVAVQIRVLTRAGEATTSDLDYFQVEKALNREVLA